MKDAADKSQTFICGKRQYSINLCPVCGGFAAADEYFRKVHIYCINCGMSGLLYSRIEDAIMEWNAIEAVDKMAI